MIRWINRAMHRRARSKRPSGVRKTVRLTLKSLDDRITPATPLSPPTLIDRTAAVRVDQDSYLIRGALQEPAKLGTTVQAYIDSNQNGTFDARVDALAASVAVARGTTAFAVPVNL